MHEAERRRDGYKGSLVTALWPLCPSPVVPVQAKPGLNNKGFHPSQGMRTQCGEGKLPRAIKNSGRLNGNCFILGHIIYSNDLSCTDA